MIRRPVLTGPVRPWAEQGFVTVELAAAAVRRSQRTIREWERRGLIRAERVGEVVLVFWPDVARESEQRPRRVRAGLSAPRGK